MESMGIKSELEITFKTKPEEILNLLTLGTKIPILKGFYKYILHDLKHFSTKSMLLKEQGNIIGHVLLFHEEEQVLYFGFFGIVGDSQEKIDILVNKTIEYAKAHNFKIIRGPINIPTIIFGWGFEEEGSEHGLFLEKPINLSIYQKVFQEKGFYVKTKLLSLEGNNQKYDDKLLKDYNFSDYEMFHPSSWEQLFEYIPIFYQLVANNLSSQSRITPGVAYLFKNYAYFIKEYGKLYMVAFLRYKSTDEIVGSLICIPNAIDLLSDEKIHSFNVFIIIVDKRHQSKGLGAYMLHYMLNKGWEHGITFASSPVESSTTKTINLAAKYGYYTKRTHLVLEYML